jgi:hypothetical protein
MQHNKNLDETKRRNHVTFAGKSGSFCLCLCLCDLASARLADARHERKRLLEHNRPVCPVGTALAVGHKRLSEGAVGAQLEGAAVDKGPVCENDLVTVAHRHAWLGNLRSGQGQSAHGFQVCGRGGLGRRDLLEGVLPWRIQGPRLQGVGFKGHVIQRFGDPLL